MSVHSLLNLENYFINELTIKVNDTFDRKDHGKIPVKINLAITDKANSETAFKVEMNYSAGSLKKQPKGMPYYLSFSITGLFSLPEKTDNTTKSNLKNLNAPSILYGIARGIVSQITASGIHGKLILPAVNFVELINQGKREQIPRKKGKK